MALIRCPECGKEISDTVKCCPVCGYSLKPKRTGNKLMLVIPILLGLFSMAWGYASVDIAINGYLGIWNNTREFIYGIMILLAGVMLLVSIWVKVCSIISVIAYGISIWCSMILTMKNPGNLILVFISIVAFVLAIIYHNVRWKNGE